MLLFFFVSQFQYIPRPAFFGHSIFRLTTNSVIYSYKHHRVLTGAELLAMQGIPVHEIDWADLEDMASERSLWSLLAGWL